MPLAYSGADEVEKAAHWEGGKQGGGKVASWHKYYFGNLYTLCSEQAVQFKELKECKIERD